MHLDRPRNSEVDAYAFIKEQLNLLGWIVKNPARFDKGEVYKQNECLSNTEIKKSLDRDMPEVIVVINDNMLWVIESKREKTEKALNYALNDLRNQYAPKLNQNQNIKCLFISAIAGNDSDGYLISNQYLHKGQWKLITKNGFEKTSLLSKEEILNILNKDNPSIDDRIEFSEEKYLKTAEKINKALHLSAINKSKRARFIAGIVLSFAAESEPNLDVKDTTLLVNQINNLIESVLSAQKKDEFLQYISLLLPPNKENHMKYRNAIIQTYRELKSLDIKSAMNSGNDVLGKFYEVFLKYGNGAKEIGIVLTPRHITKFAAEVLDIKHNDLLLDPTCGTGGFLVAGFDYVKRHSNEQQLDNFKRNNIFGIEQEDDVVALAVVNMIFRGDGKNNIKEGNCFNNHLRRKVVSNGIVSAGYYNPVNQNNNSDKVITKVMMNPPFALESSNEKEYEFIDYALKQMDYGGLLFAIVPISVMVEAESKEWRKNRLLKNNTLLAVVTFPEDLFYPVAVGTVGIFIKKGIPHGFNEEVFFVRAITDGFVKKKGKRVYSEKNKNDLADIKDELKVFIHAKTKPKSVPQFKQVCKIDPNDEYLELVPEVHLDSSIPATNEIREGIDEMIRETVSFLIRTKNEKNY